MKNFSINRIGWRRRGEMLDRGISVYIIIIVAVNPWYFCLSHSWLTIGHHHNNNNRFMNMKLLNRKLTFTWYDACVVCRFAKIFKCVIDRLLLIFMVISLIVIPLCLLSSSGNFFICEPLDVVFDCVMLWFYIT